MRVIRAKPKRPRYALEDVSNRAEGFGVWNISFHPLDITVEVWLMLHLFQQTES